MDGGPETPQDPGRAPAEGEDQREASVTIDYLKDWELHGATWRPLHVSDERAVIELCSCTGEPMDLVESDRPELIAYVRAQRPD
jgi:hypothetical protein